MKPNIKIFGTLFSLLLIAVAPSYAQMSDEAIITYVSQGVAAGKSKTQIGNELLARGVTAAQAKRLIAQYQNSQTGEITTVGSNRLDTSRSMRGSTGVSAEVTEVNPAEEMKEQDTKVELKEGGRDVVIYGHDIFKSKNLTFEPNQNLATPKSYVLGPGDEIIIDVWGINEASLSQVISPDGQIIISQVGPVTLSGLTIEQATKKLRSVLSNKYSLSGSDAQSQINVTLGRIRTIQVHVLGEVNTPGTYRLSALATAFNALYYAHGVTDIGTLRNINLIRNGRIVHKIDLYDFIFEGKKSDSMTLQDGDAILVPAYQSLVKTSGGVKRPMYYELKSGDTVDKLLKYTGGFVSNAFSGSVIIQRKDGTQGNVYSVEEKDYPSFALQDGDILTAYTNKQENLYENQVQVKGSVMRPGLYAIDGSIATVRQLITQAGGLLDDAYLLRAQIIREKKDRSLELLAIPVGEIMKGKSEDIMLKRNDVLIISSAREIEQKGDVTITGYVMNPGDYQFAEGMTIKDLILLAGGLEPGASMSKVEVGRRITDGSADGRLDTIAVVFSFDINDGLTVNGQPDFTLMPYDIVSIRKSPKYLEQRRVRVSGEATYPGEYTLVTNEERISDLFNRAGGTTRNAYIAGAMLKRRVTEDERNVRRNMSSIIKNSGKGADSSYIKKMTISETYSIGIELDKALENPGSDYDLILHDGDELVIPSLTNTVRIQGEVMYPNAVSFLPGKNARYYVDQAGGFGTSAKKSKLYVVYMNGKVAVGQNAKIKEGCEIIVPMKDETKKLTSAEWIGIGTASASIATSLTSLITLIMTTSK